jgi:hypothetical protein
LTASPPRDSAAPAAGAEDEERFQLVSITATSAPPECTGRDWHVYRISQGGNVITGYRQGDPKAVRAEVEQIVVGLNERRVSRKSRPGPKRGRPPASAAQPPKEEAEHSDD